MVFGLRGRERQRFQLFDSKPFGSSDLLFKDVTEKLAILPDDIDISQVLGLDYVALLKGLGHEGSLFLTLSMNFPKSAPSLYSDSLWIHLSTDEQCCEYSCVCR